MDLQALAIVAAAVAAPLVVVVRARWFPMVRCPGETHRRLLALVFPAVQGRCRSGRYFAVGGMNSRDCRRCGGDGHVLRTSRRICNRIRNETRNR